MPKQITVNHPLFDHLRHADKEAAKLYPTDLHDSGFGALGLILLPRLESGFYEWCTPLNAWTFAHTGGNGVHFSFLAKRDRIEHDSPVIATNPGAGMGFSNVVGEDLLDFLCLGARWGYFALEQLMYEPELTARAYTDPAWAPTEKWHSSVGFEVGEHKQQLLVFVVERFGLKPWSDANRFADLQNRFEHEIVLPPPM